MQIYICLDKCKTDFYYLSFKSNYFIKIRLKNQRSINLTYHKKLKGVKGIINDL